jgi:hypothetical protein
MPSENILKLIHRLSIVSHNEFPVLTIRPRQGSLPEQLCRNPRRNLRDGVWISDGSSKVDLPQWNDVDRAQLTIYDLVSLNDVLRDVIQLHRLLSRIEWVGSRVVSLDHDLWRKVSRHI